MLDNLMINAMKRMHAMRIFASVLGMCFFFFAIQTANAQNEENVRSGKEVLGFGVDMFSENSWNDTSRNRIVSNRTVNQNSPLSVSKWSSEVGASSSSVKKKISLEASVSGSYGAFKGSARFEGSSESSSATSTHTMLATYDESTEELYYEKGILLPRRSATLDSQPEYLDDEFWRELTTGDIKTLFDNYGTHLVRAVLIGGRVNVMFVSTSNQFTSKKVFEAKVNASYGGIIESDVKLSGEEEKQKDSMHISVVSEVLGGRARERAMIATKQGAGLNTQNIPDWAATVSEAARYVGRPEGGLIPIFKLCPAGPRKQALKDEFDRRQALFTIKNPVLFENVYATPAGGSPRKFDQMLEVPNGYKILSGGFQYKPLSGPIMLASGSYPANERTWRVELSEGWGRYKWGGSDSGKGSNGQVRIAALAIWDPMHHWKLDVVRKEQGQSRRGENDYSSSGAAFSTITKIRSLTTGVGARVVPDDGDVWLNALIPSYYKSGVAHDGIYARAKTSSSKGAVYSSIIKLRYLNLSAKSAAAKTISATLGVQEEMATRASPISEETCIIPSDAVMLGGGGGIAQSIDLNDTPFKSHFLESCLPIGESKWFARTRVYGWPQNERVTAYTLYAIFK